MTHCRFVPLDQSHLTKHTHAVAIPWTTHRYTTKEANIHAPSGIFFVFSCALYFIRICFFVLILLHFAFYLQHTTPISLPPAGFILFSLSTLSVLLCPNCPGFRLVSLLHNTHNINIHASGGIQTRNPSKWTAVDPRHRQHGHQDQR